MALIRTISIIAGAAIVTGLVAGASYAAYDSSMQAADKGVSSEPATAALIERGEYLVRAGDCVACHTAPGGKSFAGGLPFKLPFGVIYSTNITANRETGIGDWTDDDFVRALHRGVARGGRHLYPAFPYTSFTGISRNDALAIKAYLFSVPQQHVADRSADLSFPFNQRWGLAFWNLAFLRDRRFTPSVRQSNLVNHGAYLATALGHCAECHTPRNLAYGLETNRQFAGASLEGWKAYNITPDKSVGIGAWSDAQIFDYLSSAHSKGRGSASGPMGDVVQDSLQYLPAPDIVALVAYLRSIPPQAAPREEDVRPGPASLSPHPQSDLHAPQSGVGQRIFAEGCVNCHDYNGTGRQTPVAALAGSSAVNDPDGTNMTQVMLRGAAYNINHQKLYMPSFGDEYSDDELAATQNYVIAHFSGKAGQVTPQFVATHRLK